MAGFMVPEVWCDRCSLREQSEDEGTLRELRADLRLDGWVRRRTAEGLIDLCYRCARQRLGEHEDERPGLIGPLG